MGIHQGSPSPLALARVLSQAGRQMRKPGRGKTRLWSGDQSRGQQVQEQVRGISASPWALFLAAYLQPSLPAAQHISAAAVGS